MNNLKILRQERKLSQQTIAKAVGLTRQALCNYENGLREPDFATLQKLAEYFDVSVDYILGITPKKNADGYHLTDGEKKLLELFNLVPEDQQNLVLEMIKVALNSSK